MGLPRCEGALLVCADHVVMISDRYLSVTFVAEKGVDEGNTADGGSAPWTFAGMGAKAEHGTDERRGDASHDHGHADEGTESCEAEHGSDDDEDGGHDDAEVETANGSFHGGRLMDFVDDLVGVGGSAERAELPGGFEVRAAA